MKNYSLKTLRKDLRRVQNIRRNKFGADQEKTKKSNKLRNRLLAAAAAAATIGTIALAHKKNVGGFRDATDNVGKNIRHILEGKAHAKTDESTLVGKLRGGLDRGAQGVIGGVHDRVNDVFNGTPRSSGHPPPCNKFEKQELHGDIQWCVYKSKYAEKAARDAEEADRLVTEMEERQRKAEKAALQAAREKAAARQEADDLVSAMEERQRKAEKAALQAAAAGFGKRRKNKRNKKN